MATMTSYENALHQPLVSADDALWRYASAASVNVGEAANRLHAYGATPQQIGATTIRFSAYVPPGDTVPQPYYPETGTITLHPFTTDMPHANPGLRSAAAQKDARNKVREYFGARSEQLSATLAAALVLRAVDLGCQNQEMKDLHENARVGRGLVHTGAGAVALLGVYAAYKAGLTDQVVGLGFTGFGVVSVGALDALAVSESGQNEERNMRELATAWAEAAAAAAPPNLVNVQARIVPIQKGLGWKARAVKNRSWS